MARYCFYCGKELNDGEKCRCRDHFYQSGADSAEPKKQDWPNGQEGEDKGSAPDNDNSSQQEKASESQAKTGSKKDYNPFKRPFCYGRHPSFKARSLSKSLIYSLRDLGSWVREPADMIKKKALAPAQSKLPLLSIALNIFLLTIWFLVFFYNIPLQLQTLNLQTAPLQISSLIIPSLLLAVFFFLLAAFFVWLPLKITERLRISYLDILKTGRSAYIYLTLFILLAASIVSVSLLTGIAAIAAGFTFVAYVHIRSLCHIYNISGNNQIRLMVFSIILLAALFFFADRLLPLLIQIETKALPGGGSTIRLAKAASDIF